MTEKLRQVGIQVDGKRRRGGKRTQTMDEAALFLQPNDKKLLTTTKDDKIDNTIMKPSDMSSSKGVVNHQENISYMKNLLRMFDLDSNFGPCMGLSRLERWERAFVLGLHPPPEIKSFLANPLCEQECLFSKMCI